MIGERGRGGTKPPPPLLQTLLVYCKTTYAKPIQLLDFSQLPRIPFEAIPGFRDCSVVECIILNK